MLINPKYVSLLSIKQVDKLHVSNTNMYQLGLLLQQWSDNMVEGFVNCIVESIVGPHWNISHLCLLSLYKIKHDN